jgi:deazaflavin-dependent oxidoreductase (nitroreductase family)
VGRSGVASRYWRILEPGVLENVRRALRRMNRGMLFIWRLGLSRTADLWPRGFGRLMVIEHVGRRTGRPYRTPVNFTVDGGDVYCLAGFGEHTDWYRNVLARPEIAVWLPDGRWEAHAEDVSDDPRRLRLMRRVLLDSGFAAPLIGLHPKRIEDSDLAEATAAYPLLRITLLERRDAPGGPGDLAWVWWPIGGAVAAGFLARRRRRGRELRRCRFRAG